MSHTGCQLPSDYVGDTIMYYRVTISYNRKKAIFFLYVIIVAPKTVCYELMILPEFIFAFIFPFNATFPIFFFQAAAWSCSWDLNSSHYVYTGLQVVQLLPSVVHS